MNKLIGLLIVAVLLSIQSIASPPNKYNLMIAPGTLSSNSVTLLWDKQYVYENTEYEVLMNGKLLASTQKTNYTISGLNPSASYHVSIRIKQIKSAKKTFNLSFKTPAKGNILNILDYGAIAEADFINTKAIQKAIDACTKGGTVFIPKGTFVSGALYLKSNMTLQIEKGAVLKGSTDTSDYLPIIYNRFEGWELNTYASLINAGTLNRNGTYNVVNLRITGGGTIEGGGKKIGQRYVEDPWGTQQGSPDFINELPGC
ncbi:MAG: hypothetical protein IPM85_05445 [Chitinophagaceae bacterium]|nr:hypothetical protein [Chitinophagaceae bacterium]